MSGFHNVLVAVGQNPFAFKLTGGQVADIDIGGAGGDGEGQASISIRADGTVWSFSGTGGPLQLNTSTDWIRPTAFAPDGDTPLSNLTVRAELVSGDTPSGTLNSDLALTSDRTWQISQNGLGSKNCTLTITIKHNGNVVASANYELSITVTN